MQLDKQLNIVVEKIRLKNEFYRKIEIQYGGVKCSIRFWTSQIFVTSLSENFVRVSYKIKEMSEFLKNNFNLNTPHQLLTKGEFVYIFIFCPKNFAPALRLMINGTPCIIIFYFQTTVSLKSYYEDENFIFCTISIKLQKFANN